MTQTVPATATFGSGEGLQQSSSFYIHGSPDGGEDTYSVGGAPAYWEAADGGIGVKSGDSKISFAGTEADDAGTGGPYSSRLGGLLLRPQLAATRDYASEIAFNFTGTAATERVAVFCRVIPANLTNWFSQGQDGTELPNYFRSCIQGVGLEVDDFGVFKLFKYDSAGARTQIATKTSPVGTGPHTLSLKVIGRPGTITAQLDGADALPLASYDLSTGDAPSRGHAGLALTRTQLGGYAKITSFQVADWETGSEVVVLNDEWTRTPDNGGSIVPTGTTTTINIAKHKLFEWGDNKLATIGTELVGPFLRNGARRYGPKVTATAITSNTQHEFLDLWMRGADAATQVASIRWTWEAPLDTTTLLTANLAIGCAVRATKSAEDSASTPTLAAATGYVLRLVFSSPSPSFRLMRVVAGVETQLEQPRPVNASMFKPGEVHIFRLHVADSGGNPVLNAVWEDPAGVVRQIFTDVTDADATRILATNTIGIYCNIGGMGGLNPAFLVQRLALTETTIPPPTFTTEATIEGTIPFAPEFVEAAQPTYATRQTVSERLYIQSSREFIEPRTPFTARWLLQETDGQTLYDYLVARQQDRQGFAISIDGIATNFVMVEESLPIRREPGGLWKIGPVKLLEVL